MFEQTVVVTMWELAAADPLACDRHELAGLAAQAQRVRGWLDAFDARIALRAAQLAEEGSCEPAASVLAGGGRRASRDAETAARRAGVCEQMPGLHDALAGGEVSAGHVDAVARAAAQLDDAGRAELRVLEASLVGSAKALPVESFERECRDLARILSRDDGVSRLDRLRAQRRVRRWVDRQSGMGKTLLELDPESDARVWTAINGALAAERAKRQEPDTNWDHLTADAVVNLLTGAQSLDPRVPEVSVLIDLATLRDGLRDHSVCETADGTPLPPDIIRRLGCDADIIPVVLGGHGEALDVGRQQRLANRQQRRALRAMYRTCAHPDCHVAFEQCRIHHVAWWDRRGPTDLANLLPLCSLHHHLVHEGGWTLTINPDRIITLRRPDGTLHFHGTTVDRTPAAPATTAATARAADGTAATSSADTSSPAAGERSRPKASTPRAEPSAGRTPAHDCQPPNAAGTNAPMACTEHTSGSAAPPRPTRADCPPASTGRTPSASAVRQRSSPDIAATSCQPTPDVAAVPGPRAAHATPAAPEPSCSEPTLEPEPNAEGEHAPGQHRAVTAGRADLQLRLAVDSRAQTPHRGRPPPRAPAA